MSGSATLHPRGLQVLIHDFLFLYLTFRGASLFQSLNITNKAPGDGTPHPPLSLHSILQLPTQSAHHIPPLLREETMSIPFQTIFRAVLGSKQK